MKNETYCWLVLLGVFFFFQLSCESYMVMDLVQNPQKSSGYDQGTTMRKKRVSRDVKMCCCCCCFCCGAPTTDERIHAPALHDLQVLRSRLSITNYLYKLLRLYLFPDACPHSTPKTAHLLKIGVTCLLKKINKKEKRLFSLVFFVAINADSATFTPRIHNSSAWCSQHDDSRNLPLLMLLD